MKLRAQLSEAISMAVQKVFNVDTDVELSVPDEQFGDYATNVALKLASVVGKSPREISESLAAELTTAGYVAHVAGPGFLNITVSDKDLWAEVGAMPEPIYKGQSWVVEYSCPNYFKELHAGHLYQTLVGDALARLIERMGATVHRTNFGADVGLSAARAVWGILKYHGGEYPDKLDSIPLNERTAFIAQQYVEGAKADTDEADASSSEEIRIINKRIYEMHANSDTESDLAKIYFTTRGWCREYFGSLYETIRVHEFEQFYPESSTEQRGVSLVNGGLDQGVFTSSQGAIVFEGENYGLHTRVFITKENLPTYETKDLGLIAIEHDDYSFDRRVLITGSDQAEYMKVVWKAADQVMPGIEAKMTHLTNGIIKFGDGKKMSSRLGNVTRAVDVIDAVRERVEKTDDPERDERIALGAMKYEFLKYRLGGDIAFDPESSVSLQGNSGPYLQYALVRARAILAKSEARTEPSSLEPGERSLVRALSQYPSIVMQASEEFAVHMLASYLYELAGVFNVFYENNKVIGDVRERERLAIVQKYAEVLEDGLTLLGIQVPEKM